MKFSSHNSLKYKLTVSFLILATIFFLTNQKILSVESFNRSIEHRGIIEIRPYQVYPENRIGNGIYFEKKLLDSHPERMITNVISIKDTKSSAYLFKNKRGDFGLGIIKNNEDGEARFWKVDNEFYQYSNRSTGLQRVFRIFKDKITPLIPNVRTGRGITTSKTHAVFYHIINSQEISIPTGNGQEIKQRNYTFRIHLVNRNLEKVVSISNLIITDINYNLKLFWENEFSIGYKLSNGSKNIVDLRDHAPSLF